jgi:NAD(P)-dependent dehydrogenase (short-subunit alcohol dehydrogenase family)
MSKPTVLVTGGATRLGAEIIRRFSEAGWHTIIHYKSSSDDADALAATLPSAETVRCDLNDGDAAVEMVHALSARIEDWRCLVNSASVFDYDDVTGLDPATNREAMQVNAVSPTRMAQAYLASARELEGCRVINITDMKLENPNPDFFSYTMSKHALASTIRMLAMGAAGERDRVYGIAPGAILASHDQSEDEIETSHRLNLLERKTDAGEIAEAALFLADGKLRSGSTLFIDSGQHLLSQDRDVIYLARDM